ncbi:MAG: ABC transporter substrate-binding protein, partial [bacterium]|nr:ABC transporter substrate-binding protein [bacterium]
MTHQSLLSARLAALSLALLLFLSGCASSGADREPIRIGVNLWVGYDLLEVAEQEGFFADHGVDIEIVDFTSLSDVVAAYDRGQIDGMATTINEVLQVRAETSRRPEIVLVTDYSNGADVIVAAPGIDDVAGLVGRTVAVEAPLGPFILSQALATAGLSLDDVELVLADQLELPGLVAGGGAEAAVSFPPVSLELESDHGFGQIFTTASIPGEVIDVVSIDADVLARHAGLATAVRAAWDDAIGRLASHPGSTVAALAAREAIAAEEMAELLTEVELLTWQEQASQFDDGSVEATCRHAAQIL